MSTTTIKAEQNARAGEVGDFRQLYDRLAARAPALARTTARERVDRLQALRRALLRYQPALREAMQADFGKPEVETDLTEILQVTSEIGYVSRRLRSWMAPRRVATPFTLIGHRSEVMIQPKGVVLILSPWNFPVNLTFMPLVSALAAGNAVVLKPSEFTPATAGVMTRIVSEIFPPDEVVLVQGGAEVAQALLELPFHHIFFTGSSTVGMEVMARAARHLTSVTLEMGGKSPAIVTEDTDMRKAAGRIIWSKNLNGGQICVSPDYVLVPRQRCEEFVREAVAAIHRYYGSDPLQSPDLARLIHDRHFRRMQDWVDSAVAQGARLHEGGQGDPATRAFPPTLLTGVPEGHPLLEEEIFGPILPVVAYDTLEEALAFVHARPRPLAMYVFASSRKARQRILAETRAGGTAVNTALVQFYHNGLPFGGDQHSGFGKTHGHYGFLAFSNERSVIREIIPWTAVDLVLPPYGRLVRWLARLFIRWF